MAHTGSQGDAGALSPGQIEEINTHGPYNHAVWTAGGVEVTQEEQLAGRGHFLVERIREVIARHFPGDGLRSCSILDVGCYDGWILHRLSDLPFGRMVGIEPRAKNIEKGRRVREILGIPTRVEFRVGDLDSLGDERFDIVLCLGVLHHLESIPTALRRLRSVCRRLLFLETLCIPSKRLTRGIRRDLELKDLVYFYKDKVFGITGQKLETSYYDGSARALAVVSIPSMESLRMYLDVAGFESVETVVDPERYGATLFKGDRRIHDVCMSARVGEDEGRPRSEEASWVRQYEGGLMRTLLPRPHTRLLYERFCLARRPPIVPLFCRIASSYIRSTGWRTAMLRSLGDRWLADRYAREIFKNLRYAAVDKLGLEYGKELYRQGMYAQAVEVLQGVTRRLNADWRSVYRAFFLLSRLHDRMGIPEGRDRYRGLCQTSNPQFPFDALLQEDEAMEIPDV
ncbi:MAG: class I SAM-dependent methyltransferase [Planctomycetes bacterium]|nr:class I SAM-dependent methyltransferase [Planctomycetota bacterium]